jgi:hypothetical protein
MGFEYVLCGLRLRSSFRLEAVEDTSPGTVAEVTLSAVGEAELARAWSGPAAPRAWRGRLRDGAELRIERGRSDDLLFGYGEHARFHLDPARGELRCLGSELEGAATQRVLLTRVLPLVAVARGAEALHAAAVETDAGAVAVAGPSGAGKSTLVAELVRRGAALLADDVLVLRRAPGGVRAYPSSPHLSLDEPAGQLGAALAELGGKCWITVAGAARRPARLAAVVLLERGGERPLEVRELPPSPLPLAPYMLGLPDDEGREGERFALYSDLAAGARVLRLSAGEGDRPAAIAAALERALGLPAPALAGSLG